MLLGMVVAPGCGRDAQMNDTRWASAFQQCNPRPLTGRDCLLAGKVVGTKVLNSLLLDSGGLVDLSRPLDRRYAGHRVLIKGDLRVETSIERRGEDRFQIQRPTPESIPSGASILEIRQPAVAGSEVVAVWEGARWNWVQEE